MLINQQSEYDSQMAKRRKLTDYEQQWADNLKRLWSARKPDPATGRKMSQERAAELLGWDAQSTVSQYINGVIPLNTDAILGFSQIIPCDPKEINPKFGLMLRQEGVALLTQKLNSLIADVDEDKQEAFALGILAYAKAYKDQVHGKDDPQS